MILNDTTIMVVVVVKVGGGVGNSCFVPRNNGSGVGDECYNNGV